MSHVFSHNESESSGGGMAARRQPPPPPLPLPPPPRPPARQKMDDVDTLLNHMRRRSKEKLVRRASALPAMRGRSSGYVDQLGKWHIENSKGNPCIVVVAIRKIHVSLSFFTLLQSRGVSQVSYSQGQEERSQRHQAQSLRRSRCHLALPSTGYS